MASHLFMSVLCEREEEQDITTRGLFKVTVPEESNFNVTDTLWITGRVSAMLFNETTGDSLMNPNESIRDIFSVMRLKTGDSFSNTVEAISEFELVSPAGGTDFLGSCPESELIARAPLTENGEQYRYQLGLVPNNAGDFVLSWLEPVELLNEDLNIRILQKYPVDGRTDYLGLTKCGVGYAIENVSQKRREFFFTVN